QFPPSGMSWFEMYGAADNGADKLLGVLSEQPQDSEPLKFVVDYETTTGLENRHWGYSLGPYLSMAKLENYRDHVLGFLSQPLSRDLPIAGYSVLEFCISTSSYAGAVSVYIHDVAPDGTAYPLTDGQLNLRDRKLSTP